MAIDLSSLPDPQIIDPLDYETIVADAKTTFATLWAAVRAANPGLNLPAYDVSMLETDPVVVTIEAQAYRELAIRSRINDAAKSNLLKFSWGADLDNLAADHDVTRLTGETDDALKERIILKDQGSSSAGPEDWYKYWARTADVRVKDVSVFRATLGPALTIGILSTDNGGVPTSDILANVLAVVNASNIRGMNDVLSVVASTTQTVNINADIWLLPDAPQTVFDGLSGVLAIAWVTEGGIGFDLNLNWLYAKLSPSGVSKVHINAPTIDTVAPDVSSIALGTITLNYMGRSR
jgi:phage-related baseplate assembly protein